MTIIQPQTQLTLESRLTPASIKKAIRYMTQGIEGLQIEQALINLATQEYARRPVSNSVLLHELTEAEEFEKLGFDFASERLESMPYEQRKIIKVLRGKKYQEIKEPHLKALMLQYQYLAAVADSKGYILSPGTVLKFSPIHTLAELAKLMQSNPDIQFTPKPEQEPKAKDFAFELIKGEPGYAEIFLEQWGKSLNKQKYFLYNNFHAEIENMLKGK